MWAARSSEHAFNSLSGRDQQLVLTAVQLFTKLRVSQTGIQEHLDNVDGERSIIKSQFLEQIFRNYASMIFEHVMHAAYESQGPEENRTSIIRTIYSLLRDRFTHMTQKIEMDVDTGFTFTNNFMIQVELAPMLTYFSHYWLMFVAEWGQRDLTNIIAFLELNIPLVHFESSIVRLIQTHCITPPVGIIPNSKPSIINGYNVIPSEAYVFDRLPENRISMDKISFGNRYGNSAQDSEWKDDNFHVHRSTRSHCPETHIIRNVRVPLPGTVDRLTFARPVGIALVRVTQYRAEVPPHMSSVIGTMSAVMKIIKYLISNGNELFSLWNTTLGRKYFQGRLVEVSKSVSEGSGISTARFMSLIMESEDDWYIKRRNGSKIDCFEGFIIVGKQGATASSWLGRMHLEFDNLVTFFKQWSQSNYFPWYPRHFIENLPLDELGVNYSWHNRRMGEREIDTPWRLCMIRYMMGVNSEEDMIVESLMLDDEQPHYDDFKIRARRWLDNEVRPRSQTVALTREEVKESVVSDQSLITNYDHTTYLNHTSLIEVDESQEQHTLSYEEFTELWRLYSQLQAFLHSEDLDIDGFAQCYQVFIVIAHRIAQLR